VFVIARIIGGFSKGNVSLSLAIISDITPPNKRTKGMVIMPGFHHSVAVLPLPFRCCRYVNSVRIP